MPALGPRCGPEEGESARQGAAGVLSGRLWWGFRHQLTPRGRLAQPAASAGSVPRSPSMPPPPRPYRAPEAPPQPPSAYPKCPSDLMPRLSRPPCHSHALAATDSRPLSLSPPALSPSLSRQSGVSSHATAGPVAPNARARALPLFPSPDRPQMRFPRAPAHYRRWGLR